MDCILTRGLTESVLFAPKPRAGLRRRALPVADEARRGWRSGQNMAYHRHILGTARGVAKQLQVLLLLPKRNSHRCGDCFFRYGEFPDPKHFSAKIFSVPHRKLQSWQANLPELQAIQMQCRNAVQKSMLRITESQG